MFVYLTRRPGDLTAGANSAHFFSDCVSLRSKPVYIGTVLHTAMWNPNDLRFCYVKVRGDDELERLGRLRCVCRTCTKRASHPDASGQDRAALTRFYNQGKQPEEQP